MYADVVLGRRPKFKTSAPLLIAAVVMLAAASGSNLAPDNRHAFAEASDAWHDERSERTRLRSALPVDVRTDHDKPVCAAIDTLANADLVTATTAQRTPDGSGRPPAVCVGERRSLLGSPRRAANRPFGPVLPLRSALRVQPASLGEPGGRLLAAHPRFRGGLVGWAGWEDRTMRQTHQRRARPKQPDQAARAGARASLYDGVANRIIAELLSG